MKPFKYEIGEYAIVNEIAKVGLPSWVGKMVKIKSMVSNSINYDYEVTDERGESVRVKESELNTATEDVITFNQILVNNNWKCEFNDEIVTVVKVDYIYEKVEVRFDDESYVVVDLDKIELLNSTNLKDNTGKLTNKDLHDAILNEIHDTYVRKNADYGNSFEEQYKEYGLLSALIRFDDKIRRLKQLNKHEAQVKDESIRDSALDLANYAIMTVMELDKGGK